MCCRVCAAAITPFQGTYSIDRPAVMRVFGHPQEMQDELESKDLDRKRALKKLKLVSGVSGTAMAGKQVLATAVYISPRTCKV